MVNIERLYFPGQVRLISIDSHVQGCMARKVISEMYTSFVLQGTVSGRKRNEGMESWPQTSMTSNISNYEFCKIKLLNG